MSKYQQQSTPTLCFEAETLWQLTVDMAGFAEEVSFAWFDEEYQINNEQTLSHWSLAYQPQQRPFQ